jgi:hypothetical protein
MRLTLVPVSWGAAEGTGECRTAIAYEVVGLPDGIRAVVAERPGGWTVVTLDLIPRLWSACFGSPDEALDALKSAYLEPESSACLEDSGTQERTAAGEQSVARRVH